jgi:hypothetical protein
MKYIHKLLLLAGLCIPLVLPAQTMIDRIAAVVDKEIITESELNERVSFLAMQNRIDPNQK